MKRVLIALMCLAQPALSGPAEVTEATATQTTPGVWRFAVTIRHADTGWDHYADGWTVTLPDGTELGHRTLHHPHVEEQPFTRSLSGVAVPEGTAQVLIVPHDSVHGAGAAYTLPLP